jgi:hypothetical protein
MSHTPYSRWGIRTGARMELDVLAVPEDALT